MKDLSRNFLKQLLSVHGPSGWEGEVQRAWLDYVKPFADNSGSDAYGNAWAVLNPTAGPRIMVVGHSDEIGYQVNYISDEGYLYITRVGGSDLAIARGQRVRVHGDKGPVAGVIGLRPIHLKDPKDESLPKVHELFVDIGAVSKSDALKRVRVGDPITFNYGVEELSPKIWSTRAADNRIGIWAAAEVLRRCSELKKVDVCVIAVATIQEENGLYGASMAGYSLNAQAALVVDVGHATDTPLCDFKKDGEVRLGKGPILSRGSINHPLLVAGLEKTARKAKLAYQTGTDPRWSGTDADAIFHQRGGIPSASIGLPLRYMHSPVETFHLGDLDGLAELLTRYLAGVKANESFHVRLE